VDLLDPQDLKGLTALMGRPDRLDLQDPREKTQLLLDQQDLMEQQDRLDRLVLKELEAKQWAFTSLTESLKTIL
jgi:hypothetical protein